jgi:hypothetical protein
MRTSNAFALGPALSAAVVTLSAQAGKVSGSLVVNAKKI